MTTHITFLKKAVILTHGEQRVLVEHDAGALPLAIQAELLSIGRSSLYYQSVTPSPEEVAIKHHIDERYTAHPFYGSRKLTVLFVLEFGPIDRKRKRHARCFWY